MSTEVPFGPQLLGQVEKSLGALLGRMLAGSGITEAEWVTLSVLMASDLPLPPDEAAQRAARALKVEAGTAEDHLGALAQAGLLTRPGQVGGGMTVTARGRAFHTSMRHQIAELTTRLWGDLPASDLELTATVLNAVLRRAAAELAPSPG
jgi:DNA-binding MarR family transcriptional regulator